mgnify:FL=1
MTVSFNNQHGVLTTMTYQEVIAQYKDDSDSLSLMRMPSVESASGLKRSAIYKGISEGTFPAPIKITSRSSAWVKGEITEWIAKRVVNSRVDSSNQK